MGRNPKHLLPQMRLHAQSGHARVRIDGRTHWLGRFGSLEAQAAYGRLIAQYLANRGAGPSPVEGPAAQTGGGTGCENPLASDDFRDLRRAISQRGDRGSVCHREMESGRENPG